MLFNSKKLLLIAGPCSLENEKVCRAAATTLTKLAKKHPELTIIFKGSFDKANRTSLGNERGPGIDEGLALLALMKKDYGFPVLTDFHERQQAVAVGVSLAGTGELGGRGGRSRRLSWNQVRGG